MMKNNYNYTNKKKKKRDTEDYNPFPSPSLLPLLSILLPLIAFFTYFPPSFFLQTHFSIAGILGVKWAILCFFLFVSICFCGLFIWGAIFRTVMGSYGSPKTWIPYMSNKDCSQGFCSVYCPQWCYIMFSPPPPLEFPDDDSGPNFSPLVIAIVGILASVFLLISYYTIISKYCGNTNRLSRIGDHGSNDEFEDNHNPTLHEPWHVATTGLDEALIKSITVFKYKRGDGLIEGSDCSVCLSEFQEDESLRLLPKCSHAFHLQCIDNWLKSHSNCPLCRANIVSVTASSTVQLPPNTASLLTSEAMPDTSQANDHEVFSLESGRSFRNDDAKNSVRAFSDLGNLEKRDTVIELRDGRLQQIRRSISMDHCSQNHIIIANVLRLNEDEFVAVDEAGSSGDVGSSKHPMGEDSKSSHRKRILHCVMSPISMKRSFSSGRFFLTKHGREHRGMVPV